MILFGMALAFLIGAYGGWATGMWASGKLVERLRSHLLANGVPMDVVRRCWRAVGGDLDG